MAMTLAAFLIAGCATGGETEKTRPVAQVAAPTVEVQNRSSQSFTVTARTRSGSAVPLGTLRAGQTRRFVLPSHDAYISLRDRNGGPARYRRNEVVMRRIDN